MSIERFNLRVYGVAVHQGRVLLMEELIQGKRIVKFPGGGVELGEGLVDALHRELREEIAVVPTSVQHFYTTDFFQRSAYRPTDQIISVYYRVEFPEPFAVQPQEPALTLHWAELGTLTADVVTLPIDRVVLQGLLDELR